MILPIIEQPIAKLKKMKIEPHDATGIGIDTIIGIETVAQLGREILMMMMKTMKTVTEM